MGDTASIAPFVAKITAEHPELDCLINNAGVQRPLDIQREAPADFLDKADNEININVKGPLHLTIGLLPHLRARAEAKAQGPDGSASSTAAAIINVSSVLGFVPFSIVNPIYNGTKAWLHFWSINLRTQLRGTGIAVFEIAPPTVATDLHRERADPDDNKKDKNPGALSVDKFVDEVGKRLVAGGDTIGAGMSMDVVERWYGIGESSPVRRLCTDYEMGTFLALTRERREAVITRTGCPTADTET
ncbi:hypothetical protein BKA80DRAFT_252168 [Phyllosticta citrichinensis]